MNDFGYYKSIIENLEKVNATQGENIEKAASLMADAIANDRLINVYGGGGHTTLPVGEMFFRAGGLSCINPLMETGLSVFNQALKYLELERTVNYGSSIVKYYDLKKDDVLIIFHNIGINPATIDAAEDTAIIFTPFFFASIAASIVAGLIPILWKMISTSSFFRS